MKMHETHGAESFINTDCDKVLAELIRFNILAAMKLCMLQIPLLFVIYLFILIHFSSLYRGSFMYQTLKSLADPMIQWSKFFHFHAVFGKTFAK